MEQSNLVGKFMGGNKIAKIGVSDNETPAGVPILKLEYEDGKIECMPAVMVVAVASDEPLDPSSVRTKRVVAVCKAIIETFGEYDIKFNEWDAIQFTIKGTIDENFARATSILWKTEEKHWLDMVKILKDSGIEMVSD